MAAPPPRPPGAPKRPTGPPGGGPGGPPGRPPPGPGAAGGGYSVPAGQPPPPGPLAGSMSAPGAPSTLTAAPGEMSASVSAPGSMPESKAAEEVAEPTPVRKPMTVEDAILEFYATEKKYVETLTRGYELFQGTLLIWDARNKPIIKKDDIYSIFGGFQTIGEANRGFHDDLVQLGLKGGIPAVRDGLGDQVMKFAPLLKLYTEYIDNIKSMIGNLERIRGKSKKFDEFCQVAEELTGRTLQSYLEEPVKRLPMYLQLLANIYAAVEVSGFGDTEAGYKLFEAVDFMKKTIDEIAQKTRDKKARMFCGQLHRKLFKGKVDFSKPDRLVYRTSNVRYLVSKATKVQQGFMILCNDILLLTTVPKRGCKIIAVWPTYELRVVYDTPLPKTKKPIPDCDNRFAIITQNKRFVPVKPEFGLVIFLCKSAKQVKNWTTALDSAIDEEEHNLHPTNPVQLLQRLKKESGLTDEGKKDKTDISDPNIVKQIQAWRKARGEGIKLPRGFATAMPDSAYSSGPSMYTSAAPTSTAAPGGGGYGGPPPGGPPGGPPPGRPPPGSRPSGPPSTGPGMSSASMIPSYAGSSGGSSSYGGGGPGGPPSRPPGGPPSGPPSGPPAVPSSARPSGPPRQPGPPGGPPPAHAYSGGGPPSGPPRVPPSVPGAGPGGPPPFRGGPPSSPPGRPSSGPGGGPPKRPMGGGGMAGVLAGIRSFDKDKLNEAEAVEVKKNVDSVLHNTLANYRQFVMDEDSDDDDDDDNDWE